MIDKYLSPSELRRLASALLVVLGFISLAGLFGFTIVPGLRYQAHTGQDALVAEVQGETGWLDPTDVPVTRRQEIPPIDPKTVMTPSPELMARGKALFASTCATCHGPEGKGDGPGGAGLKPAPRNLVVAEGWKNGTRIEDLWKTLEEGLKGTSMVSYSYLSKKDRMALVHVVQSMGSFDHGASDPKARAALEALFASAGEVIPNRIPVRRAVELMASEFQPGPALPGALVDDPAVRNPQRAAVTLAGLPGWQTSEQALARGVVAGLPDNGFAPAVAGYDAAQWKALQARLLGK